MTLLHKAAFHWYTGGEVLRMSGADKEKFKNMILFFSHRLPGIPKVKLAKMLYYSDFGHFKAQGKSISGADYIHLEFGPCPKIFDVFLNNLAEGGALEVIPKTFHPRCAEPKDYFTFTAKQKPDMKLFNLGEISTMESVFEKYRRMSGQKLSEKSHAELPWKATRPQQTIPYNLILYDDHTTPSEPEDSVFAKSPELRKLVDTVKAKRKRRTLATT